MSFAKSFQSEFAKTNALETVPTLNFKISASMVDYIAKQRISIAPVPVFFVFFRNFDKKKRSGCTVTLERRNRNPIMLTSRLPYKKSFVGIGNYTTRNGLVLLLSTIPIYVRTVTAAGHELWIVQCDDEIHGQFAFQGDLQLDGNLNAVTERQEDSTVVSFKKSSGWCHLELVGNPDSKLVVIALTGTDLLSLTPIFRENFWSKSATEEPLAVLWGVHGITINPLTNKITLKQCPEDTKLSCITSIDLPEKFVTENEVSSITLDSYPDDDQQPSLPTISFSKRKVIDFNKLQYTRLEATNGMPNLNFIDLCFTSGYTVYRLNFELGDTHSDLTFDINMRHRVVLYLNDQIFGSHMIYSLHSLRPGSKNGPEGRKRAGIKRFTLPKELLKNGTNRIVCIIESLGLNRCPGTLDDVRNDRGLVEAQVNGGKIPLEFEVCGVDVRDLREPYGITGMNSKEEWVEIERSSEIPKGITKPTWFKGTFKYDHGNGHNWIAPLRLALHGDYMAYVTLNGTLIAKYYGQKQGPQHDFYVPEGLVQDTNDLEVMTFGVDPLFGLDIKLLFWNIDGFYRTGNVKNDGDAFLLVQYEL
jgi:hypothetical protein